MSIQPTAPADVATSNRPEKPAPSPAQQQQTQLDADILIRTEAKFGVRDQPLALLLRTAIDRLNEVLGPVLGDNAIQKLASDRIDVSPEATAQRIVSLSTGFFSAYQALHPDKEDAEVLEQFMAVIGKGIDQGFKDARDILSGLNVLAGDIATNIDKTYALVMEGLQAFREQTLPEPA